MRVLKTLFVVLCLVTVCMSTIGPAYASDGIEIEVNGGQGITIKPGEFPDLGGDVDAARDAAGKEVISKSKEVAQTITSICTIICFIAFLVNIVRLATSSGLPYLRHAALIGLLWSGIALALFGGAWVIVSFFWNFLS